MALPDNNAALELQYVNGELIRLRAENESLKTLIRRAADALEVSWKSPELKEVRGPFGKLITELRKAVEQ